jgi:ubiquinone/menaquinone biosynthesis C-methylase UbiE
MQKSAQSDSDKWSRYWSDGRIAACMADAGGSYGDQLGEQWRRWFEQLPECARVLDLATGNGALVHLALASGKGSRLRLVGVDYAAIEPWRQLPAAHSEHKRIRFYGHTNIEQLPFAAGMFDAVVSQYGAEYAETGASIAEAVRVLARGGCLRWVCHHRDSTIYRNTCSEIEHARFVLEQAQPDLLLAALLQRQIEAGRFIEQSHQRTASTPQRQALNAALSDCLQRLRAATPASEFLDMVLQNLAYIYQHREQHAPELVLQKVAEVRVEMEVFLGRMQALVSSALDNDKVNTILARLAAHGMHAGEAEMVHKHNGDIIGVAISASKPTQAD